MRGSDVFVDGFPHGTPEGYDRGCRGGACPSREVEGQMLCREAKVRYQGDWEYRRLVDAGEAPLSRAVFEGEGRPVAPVTHGTVGGYRKGCRGDACPSKVAGGLSCSEVKAASQRAWQEKQKAARVSSVGAGEVEAVRAKLRAAEQNAVLDAEVIGRLADKCVELRAEVARLREELAAAAVTVRREGRLTLVSVPLPGVGRREFWTLLDEEAS